MNSLVSRDKPAEVLLVEDNDNDVELTRLALQKCSLPVNLHHARNGEQCMAFLRREGNYADAVAPDLILLDLNMPRKGGREVLAEIVADRELCHLPVVILTTSSGEEDMLELYRMRCSSYLVKPVDFHQFARAMQSLVDYWFGVVSLPSRSPLHRNTA